MYKDQIFYIYKLSNYEKFLYNKYLPISECSRFNFVFALETLAGDGEKVRCHPHVPPAEERDF